LLQLSFFLELVAWRLHDFPVARSPVVLRVARSCPAVFVP
jgi:hypothetical protein